MDAESSRGTDLAGATSFALREIEARSLFYHPVFLDICNPTPGLVKRTVAV